jgi:hypothetical protein
MQFTSELVAKVSRVVTDSGPLPDFVPMTDGDYESLADDLLAHWPTNGPLWVFACGSLLWKPKRRRTAAFSKPFGQTEKVGAGLVAEGVGLESNLLRSERRMHR